MSKHLLIAFHGTLAGVIPAAPSIAIPLNDDQAGKFAEAIATLDPFDLTPGDGEFEVHASGSVHVPFIGGVKFDGVQSLSIVTTADPVKTLEKVQTLTVASPQPTT